MRGLFTTAILASLVACQSRDIQPRESVAASTASAPRATAVLEPAATQNLDASGAFEPQDSAPAAVLRPPVSGQAPPPSPLPSAAALLGPLRAAGARSGFVAVTNGRDHLVVPLDRSSGRPRDAGDLAAEEPVLVASFTKLWTVIAVARMIERQELRLDETVAEAIPSLAKRPWASSTIRELMTHTSLVPEFDERGGYYRSADVDFRSPVAAITAHVPRAWSEKRGVYKYRNAEFAILGAILTERSHLPAERLLEREVFGPAGMRHAGLLVGRPPQELDMIPVGPIRPQNFFTAGAGYASPSDLLSFFDALASEVLLPSTALARIFTGSDERDGAAFGCWAYPFARHSSGTTLLVERPGSFGNVRVISAFFPEEKRAVVAFSSSGTDLGRPRKARSVANALAHLAIE